MGWAKGHLVTSQERKIEADVRKEMGPLSEGSVHEIRLRSIAGRMEKTRLSTQIKKSCLLSLCSSEISRSTCRLAWLRDGGRGQGTGPPAQGSPARRAWGRRAWGGSAPPAEEHVA